jgi:hypothetical protein
MAPTSASASQGDHSTAGRLAGTLGPDAGLALGAGVSLLIVGEANAALLAIAPILPQPVLTSRGSEPLGLPDPRWIGTILILEVDHLAAGDQLQLLHWLDLSDREAQIVTTASASLLPMVDAGQFLETLYYRLNMVRIDMTAGPSEPNAEVPGGEQLVDTIAFEWPPRV